MDELTWSVVEEISRIATAELELGRQVLPTDRLVDDLQLDSMGMTVLAVGLEDRFRIKLTEEDAARVTTVQELAAVVARRTLEEGEARV
jgi:acyl carrier protein